MFSSGAFSSKDGNELDKLPSDDEFAGDILHQMRKLAPCTDGKKKKTAKKGPKQGVKKGVKKAIGKTKPKKVTSAEKKGKKK